MNMSRVLALAGRILRQVVRDKRTLALIFVVPIVVMTLLYLVLTGTSSVPTLAIVRPTGPGSESIDSLITRLLPGKDKLNVIYVNADQVDSTLQNGNADAAVIFPPDFGQQMLNNQHPTVQIKLEGSDPNVASAMSDLTQSFTRQLGIAIAGARDERAKRPGHFSRTRRPASFHHWQPAIPARRPAVYL